MDLSRRSSILIHESEEVIFEQIGDDDLVGLSEKIPYVAPKKLALPYLAPNVQNFPINALLKIFSPYLTLSLIGPGT